MNAPDRFISPCAPPEGREREILTILIEEAAEVIQRATKMLRFGVTEAQPGQPYDNADRLSHETGDLLEMFHMAQKAGLVRSHAIAEGRGRKLLQLAKFMQTEAPVEPQHSATIEGALKAQHPSQSPDPQPEEVPDEVMSAAFEAAVKANRIGCSGIQESATVIWNAARRYGPMPPKVTEEMALSLRNALQPEIGMWPAVGICMRALEAAFAAASPKDTDQ